MYFTSGGDRAFESLMQGKPGFDHYDSGDAGAPEDCGDCRFYRPDWKYQFCVYAECPYQPGKLAALDAVKFRVKGVDEEMAVFRVEKNRGYSAAEERFMDDYRQLTSGNRYAVSVLTQTLLKVQQAESSRAIRKLTLFECPLAAGVGDPNEFEDSGVPIYVYDDSLTQRADCVFIVNGDSMEPDYPDGCRVLVERISDSGELAPGDIGAFMIDNETYIKEYQPDGLHSRNPSYPVMSFSEFEHVYLIGRVIGVLSKSDVAQPSDVEKYIELHPEFE